MTTVVEAELRFASRLDPALAEQLAFLRGFLRLMERLLESRATRARRRAERSYRELRDLALAIAPRHAGLWRLAVTAGRRARDLFEKVVEYERRGELVLAADTLNAIRDLLEETARELVVALEETPPFPVWGAPLAKKVGHASSH